MTRSDLLRQALDIVRDGSGTVRLWPAKQVVEDAARFALKVWEGDQQLVERLAIAMHDAREATRHKPAYWIEQTERTKDYYRRMVRAVLAAITEEDKK